MTGTKTSIYLDDATLRELAARGNNLSATIRRIVLWYAEIMRREMPGFDQEEFACIAAALPERIGDDIGPLAANLAGEVACGMTAPACPDVVEWIAVETDFAGRVAVIDRVIRMRMERPKTHDKFFPVKNAMYDDYER